MEYMEVNNLKTKPNGTSINSVAVLCRGKSLDYIDMLPDVDLYVLSNRFGTELEVDKIKNKISDADVHHVMNRWPTEPREMIEQKHYDKYNIKKVIQPYTVYMKDPFNINDGNNRYYRVIDDKFYFCGGSNPIPALMLGDHHIEHMSDYEKRYPHHWPTTGNATIGYSVLDTSATDVHIIGMDFYESPYFTFENEGGGPTDGKPMKESLIELIKNFSNKNFKVYTYGNIDIDSDNCEVIKFNN
jgi:hypothetical protein